MTEEITSPARRRHAEEVARIFSKLPGVKNPEFGIPSMRGRGGLPLSPKSFVWSNPEAKNTDINSPELHARREAYRRKMGISDTLIQP